MKPELRLKCEPGQKKEQILKPEHRLKLIVGLLIAFVAVSVWQMGKLMLVGEGELRSLASDQIPALLIAALLGYSAVRAAAILLAQGYGTRRCLRDLRSKLDHSSTLLLRRKYGHWGVELLAVRDEAFYAFAIGLFRPGIVISTAALELFPEEELEAILLHERHHCLNRDNLRLFSLKLLSGSFAYFPVIRPVADYCRTWTELLADRYAIRRMGTSLHLGQVLLKLVRMGVIRQREPGLQFAESALDYRMLQVLEPDGTIRVPLVVFRPLLLSLSFMLLLIISGSS